MAKPQVNRNFEAAAKVLIEKNSGSISLIKRELNVSVQEAVLLMDQLEKYKVIGQNGQGRVVLMNEKDLENLMESVEPEKEPEPKKEESIKEVYLGNGPRVSPLFEDAAKIAVSNKNKQLTVGDLERSLSIDESRAEDLRDQLVRLQVIAPDDNSIGSNKVLMDDQQLSELIGTVVVEEPAGADMGTEARMDALKKDMLSEVGRYKDKDFVYVGSENHLYQVPRGEYFKDEKNWEAWFQLKEKEYGQIPEEARQELMEFIREDKNINPEQSSEEQSSNDGDGSDAGGSEKKEQEQESDTSEKKEAPQDTPKQGDEVSEQDAVQDRGKEGSAKDKKDKYITVEYPNQMAYGESVLKNSKAGFIGGIILSIVRAIRKVFMNLIFGRDNLFNWDRHLENKMTADQIRKDGKAYTEAKEKAEKEQSRERDQKRETSDRSKDKSKEKQGSEKEESKNSEEKKDKDVSKDILEEKKDPKREYIEFKFGEFKGDIDYYDKVECLINDILKGQESIGNVKAEIKGEDLFFISEDGSGKIPDFMEKLKNGEETLTHETAAGLYQASASVKNQEDVKHPTLGLKSDCAMTSAFIVGLSRIQGVKDLSCGRFTDIGIAPSDIYYMDHHGSSNLKMYIEPTANKVGECECQLSYNGKDIGTYKISDVLDPQKMDNIISATMTEKGKIQEKSLYDGRSIMTKEYGEVNFCRLEPDVSIKGKPTAEMMLGEGDSKKFIVETEKDTEAIARYLMNSGWDKNKACAMAYTIGYMTNPELKPSVKNDQVWNPAVLKYTDRDKANVYIEKDAYAVTMVEKLPGKNADVERTVSRYVSLDDTDNNSAKNVYEACEKTFRVAYSSISKGRTLQEPMEKPENIDDFYDGAGIRPETEHKEAVHEEEKPEDLETDVLGSNIESSQDSPEVAQQASSDTRDASSIFQAAGMYDQDFAAEPSMDISEFMDIEWSKEQGMASVENDPEYMDNQDFSRTDEEDFEL